MDAPFQPRYIVEDSGIVWGLPAISSSYPPDASNPTTTTVSHATYGSPVAIMSHSSNTFRWEKSTRATLVGELSKSKYYSQPEGVTEQDKSLEEVVTFYSGIPELGESSHSHYEDRFYYLASEPAQYIMCKRFGETINVAYGVTTKTLYSESLFNCYTGPRN